MPNLRSRLFATGVECVHYGGFAHRAGYQHYSDVEPAGFKREPKSAEAKSVDPQVESEIERMEADKRVSLLADAVLALDATRTALTALDKGDKSTAVAPLERAEDGPRRLS